MCGLTLHVLMFVGMFEFRPAAYFTPLQHPPPPPGVSERRVPSLSLRPSASIRTQSSASDAAAAAAVYLITAIQELRLLKATLRLH